MKNLLVYINKDKAFDPENAKQIRIQIDSSLDFWNPSDIVLATNFEFEYHGIKSFVVPDSLFCDFEPRNSKGNCIVYLLENKVLEGTTWVHDIEAFQIAPFDLKIEKDLGLTDYGWKDRWNSGSIFFKNEALDIFRKLQEDVYQVKAPDEPVLWHLFKNNYANIQSRYEKLNITYNVGMRHIEENIAKADKPVKVLHLHPYRHNIAERYKKYFSPKLNKLIEENF